MSGTDPSSEQPAQVIRLSPTEMSGDWPAEVTKKLVSEGIDPALATEIAKLTEAETRHLPWVESKPSRSMWQRLFAFLGLRKPPK